jgi:hypothetical protein
MLQILLRLRVIGGYHVYNDGVEFQDVNDLDEIRDRVTDKLLKPFAPHEYFSMRRVWYSDAGERR